MRPRSSAPAASWASGLPRWRTRCPRSWPGTGCDGRPCRRVPDDRQLAIARQLRRQADWCAESGESLYAGLLRHSAEDAARGGPVWNLLQAHAAEPAAAALPLRFLAGVNRLVLSG